MSDQWSAHREPTVRESAYCAVLPLFERLLDESSRGAGLSSEEASRFSEWAKRRLFELNSGILRGEPGSTMSSPASYLTVLLQCLLLEFRAEVPADRPQRDAGRSVDRSPRLSR